jgi:hypothetical protein
MAEIQFSGKKIKVCCNDFAHAYDDGTDGEGYGCLFYRYNDGSWHGGCHRTPLKYCPWCSSLL